MKFLIIQKIKKQVPLESWTKLLPAQFKYLEGLEKQGEVETSYHMIGYQRNLLIVNVKSDEELTKIISEDPMFFHSTREVFPLTTRETHIKYLKQLMGVKQD